ncbi:MULTISPECIES: c-type cytochrome [Comamonas]|uniref:c-type cytochrome n=1 Tax=Comamonas TaxID=283 RepID=UPI00257DD107|nr:MULTISPECIES: c-type cytochrome [Comamonas]
MPLSPVHTLRPALWLAAALLAPAALAQTTATATAAASTAGPSVQDISLIAGTCANCHGPDGRSTGGIPSLRGVHERHLLQRLQAFKAGTATDATVMTRLMKGYDDAQIQALAQWFSKEAN